MMKRYIAILIIFIPLFLLSGEIPENYEPVLRKGDLALYFNSGNFRFFVEDTSSGNRYFSNPAGEDPLANDFNRARLQSQLVVTCYTPEDQAVTLDSHTYSFLKEGIEARITESGVRLVYNFNTYERGEGDIPLMIDSRTYTLLQNAAVKQSVQISLERRFKYVEEAGAYRRYAIPDFEVETYLNLFDQIGYTGGNLESDRKRYAAFTNIIDENQRLYDMGLRINIRPEQDRIRFSVPVEYILDETGFSVEIDPAGIVNHSPEYKISTIQVLEFFGAYDNSREGGILLPDGSGALISFPSNRVERLPQYRQRLFGPGTAEVIRESIYRNSTLSLPLFALYRDGQSGFWAEIESGAEAASVFADTAGFLTSYNIVASEVRYREQGRVVIGEGNDQSRKLLFQDTPLSVPYRIAYHFLSPEKAGYAGIASEYAGLLFDGQSVTVPGRDLPLVLEIPCVVKKKKNILGMQFQVKETLTSFAAVEEMIDSLKSRGIGNIHMILSGWMNGGLIHSSPDRISVEKGPGGRKGLEKLLDYASAEGVEIYPSADLKTLYDRYSRNPFRTSYSRSLDQSVYRDYVFNRATFQIDPERPSTGVLKPDLLAGLISQFAAETEKLGFSSLDLGAALSEIWGDYSEKRECPPTETSSMINEALAGLPAEGAGNLGGEVPLAPYLARTTLIRAVPFTSGGNPLFAADIPFYGLVVRGHLKAAAGESLNLVSDLKDWKLSSIDSGVLSPFFLITEKSSSTLKETEFNELFSTDFKTWVPVISRVYGELNNLYGLIGNAELHNQFRTGEGLVVSRFDGDITVVTNHSGSPLSYGNHRVSANDFIVLQGDTE
ncbi:MAG: hypothetical protein JXR86_18145 [Spirochaetales bacterium]|nr:hypothetical protein [Spirochaetales bacterium]